MGSFGALVVPGRSPSQGGGLGPSGASSYDPTRPLYGDTAQAEENRNVDYAKNQGTAMGARTNAFINSVPSLAALFGGSGAPFGTGGGGGSSFGVSTGTTPAQVPAIPPVQMPDTSAATAAAFAQAKDKVGQMSRASLDSLNGELGAQGMLGGGAQVQGTRDIISSGMGQLGDTARTLAEKNSDIAADFAKTGYEGSITQRGQDIAASEANRRLDLDAQNLQLNRLQAVMRSLGGISASPQAQSDLGYLY